MNLVTFNGMQKEREKKFQLPLDDNGPDADPSEP